jgi:hypothetical protein
MTKMTNDIKSISFFLLLILLSGCKISNLQKLIDFTEPKKGEKPCVISVWPAVKSGDKKYKMTEKKADRFIIRVQAATGYKQKYKRIKANRKKIPSSCKKLLWHDGSQVSKEYRSCMVTWGKNTIKNHEFCTKDASFVIGSAITSSNGRAKILIVNLDKPNRYANKKNRYARGRNLNKLARNLGKAIRKEVR